MKYDFGDEILYLPQLEKSKSAIVNHENEGVNLILTCSDKDSQICFKVMSGKMTKMICESQNSKQIQFIEEDNVESYCQKFGMKTSEVSESVVQINDLTTLILELLPSTGSNVFLKGVCYNSDTTLALLDDKGTILSKKVQTFTNSES
eukprot:TRINITY_DN190360_c1_g2_i2.p1 TRINITY_DN190360_c1_g2~~TRINITY_DN190360_c1_g2_i2.p1  ORF type:complete len:148 (-),score=30.94 TRINITY_DN190360_c1_g2_i2:719-1162(-)